MLRQELLDQMTNPFCPISANLRDLDPPNGSCDHGPMPVLSSGRRNPKPVRDLSVEMGPVAMTTAQKALQAWQTRPKALGGIAASDLLTQEIETGFSQHPFGERGFSIILPPGGSKLGLAQGVSRLGKLCTVQGIPHRQTDGGALLFQQGPAQQKQGQRRLR